MNDTNLIKTGGIGAVLAVICCATPVLVIALAALGLSAWAGNLDAILRPILGLSVGLIGYGLYKRRQHASACCASDRAKTITPGT